VSIKDVADFAAKTSFTSLPSNVITQAKLALQDNLGVMLAAHKDRAVEAARRVAQAIGGRKESTLIGTGIKVPCNIASWVNAVMGSTLDMDDGAMGQEGHRAHAGGMVVPSCLAVAERQSATGVELIEALVIGFEIAVRTGWMMGVGTMAGKVGTYGVAAATAKLLGLSPEKIANAVAIAEAHRPDPAQGTLIEHPGMVKEAIGWGAMTGVSAALLAQAGFTGSRTTYDLPEHNQKPMESLGKEWEMMGLYFKPYSMCRNGHTSLDGVLELVKEHDLKADDISKITVGVCSKTVRMINYPPATIWEAQYSVPFTVGAAVVDGEVGPEQIAETRLGDRTILNQAEKVRLVTDPEAEALWPQTHAARVEIETKDGRKFKVFKRYPKGGAENPLSEKELRGKFRKLAVRAIGVDRTEALSTCIDRLEKLNTVNELIEQVANF